MALSQIARAVTAGFISGSSWLTREETEREGKGLRLCETYTLRASILFLIQTTFSEHF